MRKNHSTTTTMEVPAQGSGGAAPSATERRFRALIEHSSDMKALIDSQGNFLYASPSTTRILGYSLEEYVSRNAFDFIHPEDRKRTQDLLAALVQKPGATITVEYRMLAKDGTWRWIEGSGTNLLADPDIRAVVANYHDITERKRAEEALRQSEARYRVVAETAADAIVTITPDSKIVFINSAAERIFGYRREEMLERDLTMLMPEYLRQVHKAGVRRYLATGEKHINWHSTELTGLHKSGSEVPLEVSFGESVVEGQHSFTGIVRDISQRKRAEAERQVIFEIIHALNFTANLDELLHLIHQALKKVLYAENCFVALYDHGTGMFHFPFFVDQFDEAPPPQKVGRSCTAYVFRTGQPMLIPQKLFDQLAVRGEVELVGTPSPTWLGVPLRTPSETIGVLVVQHYEDDRAYGERDLEFLTSVGGQIALAIERKRAEEALRASENRLRAIIDTEPECVKLLAADGTLLEMN